MRPPSPSRDCRQCAELASRLGSWTPAMCEAAYLWAAACDHRCPSSVLVREYVTSLYALEVGS